MRAFVLVLELLRNLHLVLCGSCLGNVCKEIPTSYPAGMSSLVLWVSNVGEINSTVFNHTNLASVTSLVLEKAGITAISPGAFDKFQNLKTLNLCYNDITLVTSAWFTHKEALENINLSSNSISALNDDAFHGLSGLSKLNLSNNQIQNITTNVFHSLSNLRYLDLSNNKLSHLRVATLYPLNRTKVYLNGNPWNCSYTDFTDYVKGLHKASLLENNMEVTCDSPPCLRGVPVWNISECVEPSTAADPTVGNIHTLQPAAVQPQINWSVLIVLIVLYHRKRERKHLQTIRPSPEEPKIGKRPLSSCREAKDCSTNLESVVPDSNKNILYTTKVLQRLDQTKIETEKVSQICQIYGTGIHQSNRISNRAKSAGPILSRNVLCRQLETEMEEEKDVEVYSNCVGTGKEEAEDGRWDDGTLETKEKWQECGSDEELQVGTAEDGSYEFITMLEPHEKCKENLIMEGEEEEGNTLEENTRKQEFLYNDDNAVLCLEDDHLTSSSTRHDPYHSGTSDALRSLEDLENIPYLTIGTDAGNQRKNPNPSQMPTEASLRRVPLRPFQRVLTWPPTAIQWKKQWAQHQQVLSVFPRIIFVTGSQHQTDTFPVITSKVSPENEINTLGSSLSSARPEKTSQDSCCEEMVHKSQREVTDIKSVESLKEMCESAIHSYIQNLPISAQEYAQSGGISQNSQLRSKVLSDWVHSKPRCEEKHSEESVTPCEDNENVKRSNKAKATNQILTSDLRESEMQWRKRQRVEGKKSRRGRRRNQSGSGSKVPSSGGSPTDDHLLVDNEYAFIDLLHEVVENHGRWTRERWRQSQMNKQKLKPPGKSN